MLACFLLAFCLVILLLCLLFLRCGLTVSASFSSFLLGVLACTFLRFCLLLPWLWRASSCLLLGFGLLALGFFIALFSIGFGLLFLVFFLAFVWFGLAFCFLLAWLWLALSYFFG